MAVIKKHHNKNEYLLAGSGLWVRNFAKKIEPVDINNFTLPNDYDLMIKNEIANRSLNLPQFHQESFSCRDAIIISDGHSFEDKQNLIESLPKHVKIICVNYALAKWKIKRKIDFYVVNNPYDECINFLPNYYPPCIASSRTNPKFIQRYKSRKGIVYLYQPVKEEKFSSNLRSSDVYIDDYRNPICASLCLLHRFGVERVLLFCCDDVFADERAGAIKVNDMWMYPQHQKVNQLVDGCLFWMSNDLPCRAASYGDGPEFNNAKRITEINSFFS